MEDVKITVRWVTWHGPDEGLEQRRSRINRRDRYDAEIPLLIPQNRNIT